ncbi:mercury resistance system periplasmic binding protein MerP [Sulfurirhabdus autotrophica]|uniref:Periplasmic mercury ion-binding protein n=1 Tax=Sulfurirhabdus autotrophica TaxID=1706046 RepID=A0A4R3Y859_9PROT|nr:mercury resistance system periplasmic binding protein MerP [Sulfurirhabdus autotrophica]TCV86764.1 mercuric ion binding protein [Sulfurirhabdus autotrophica]
MNTRLFGFAVLLSSFLFTPVAYSATQTVTLGVPDMYCEVCPITVKKSLVKVPGVSKVNVSLESKEAVVTFDDAKTNVSLLMDATKNAGYPSTVKPPRGK